MLMVAQSRRFSDAVRELVRRLPRSGHPPGAHCLSGGVRPAAHGVVAFLAQAGGLVILLQGATRSTASTGGSAGPRRASTRPRPARTRLEGEDEADIVCRFAGGTAATVHLSLSTSPAIHEALVVGARDTFA